MAWMSAPTPAPDGVTLEQAGTAWRIKDRGVTGPKVALDAIDSEHYADGSIDPEHHVEDPATQAELNAAETTLQGNIDAKITLVPKVDTCEGNNDVVANGQVLMSIAAAAGKALVGLHGGWKDSGTGGNMDFTCKLTFTDDTTETSGFIPNGSSSGWHITPAGIYGEDVNSVTHVWATNKAIKKVELLAAESSTTGGYRGFLHAVEVST